MSLNVHKKRNFSASPNNFPINTPVKKIEEIFSQTSEIREKIPNSINKLPSNYTSKRTITLKEVQNRIKALSNEINESKENSSNKLKEEQIHLLKELEKIKLDLVSNKKEDYDEKSNII